MAASSDRVLFVSHGQRRCGVQAFGRRVADALRGSRRFEVQYVECDDEASYAAAVRDRAPAVVIYNHHPSTMPWLNARVLRRQRAIHVGIVHEVTQDVADRLDDRLFDAHVAPDPTLLLRNPIVFKTGRLVPSYFNRFEPNEVPVIASFGFATHGKGFERLAALVQAQFDQATLRLHIPFAAFGDDDGARARGIADRCRGLVTKRGITVEVSHDFLTEEALLDFLARSSINAFPYEDQPGRGISSVTDFALAVGRPLAVSESSMFRHLWPVRPTIRLDRATLPEILARGSAPTARLATEWSVENLVWDYERLLERVLVRRKTEGGRSAIASTIALVGDVPVLQHVRGGLGVLARAAVDRAEAFARQAPAGSPVAVALQVTRQSPRLRSQLRQVRAALGGQAVATAAVGDWVPSEGSTPAATDPVVEVRPYQPIPSVDAPLNRLLDDRARALYAPAIAYLGEAAPRLLARKIARANVQQAFVLDTVLRLVGSLDRPRLLSAGSYEDTATAAVMASGHFVEEIDPVINYDLTTYLTKPTCRRGSFDAVFATSVIEHVVDDEAFIAAMEELLGPGGYGVLTCDFNDSYRAGDPIPREDRRLYTQRDFTERWLPLLSRSKLVDEPDWNGAPDFTYGGCNYSFATFVFQRIR